MEQVKKALQSKYLSGKIVLTGPKHSGKTSAGKTAAKMCACDFIDLDELVLQKTGKSPRQLFSESPEIFKKAEVEALDEVLYEREKNEICRIIATGGGIIDNVAAIKILSNINVLKVYLDISAAAAWQRIAAAAELPPFLRTENPQETHRILHERRAAAYLQLADITVKADGKSPEEIAAEILNRV